MPCETNQRPEVFKYTNTFFVFCLSLFIWELILGQLWDRIENWPWIMMTAVVVNQSSRHKAKLYTEMLVFKYSMYLWKMKFKKEHRVRCQHYVNQLVSTKYWRWHGNLRWCNRPNSNHWKTIIIAQIIENYGSIESMIKLISLFNYQSFPKI